MDVLDGSITTVALPSIQRDLHFSAAGWSWVVNGYLLALGSLLLLAGRLGDLLGRRRIFLAGVGVFTAASAWAGLAGSAGMLVAARFAQGAGAAMASAVGLGILVTLFPEPRERARALGVFAFTGSAGAVLGQVLGGVLTQTLGWHSIFLINLPIGAAVLLVGARVLPKERGLGLRAGMDALGAALGTAGLLALIYGIVGARPLAWGAGLVLLGLFAVRQATARNPLLPPRVLRNRSVLGANLAMLLMVGALFSFQVLTAQYLQDVADWGAAATGLAMLPAALAIGAVSLGASARLIGRFGELRVLLFGLTLLVALLVLLTRIPEHPDYLLQLLPLMLLGAGFGLAQPALLGLGMSGAGEGDAGLVSGLFTTFQQVGMASGVAVLSTLAASRTEALRHAGAAQAAALAGGYRLAWAVGAGLLVAAALTAGTLARRRAAGAAPAEERRGAREQVPTRG
nr:MFS transporter [Mangrovactinospora gilvigrisea]